MLKGKKYFIITIIIFLLVTLLIIINPFVRFNKNINDKIVVDVNSNFKLPQIKAFFINKDITNNINIENHVNINKIGNYKIICKVKYLIFSKSKEISVQVIDREKPKIKLLGDLEKKLCPNEKYVEEGYSAIDNYDGDITNKVNVIKNKEYNEYQVKDSSNNFASVRRKLLIIDDESPKIQLIGDDVIYIYRGNSYEELGYSSIDNCDKDITSNVEIENNVDTNINGNYVIKYKSKDSSGNEAVAERHINVIEPQIKIQPTYINGILLVNKKYPIPSDFGGLDNTAYNALQNLQVTAINAGYSMPLLSGYRSYYDQQYLFNYYVSIDGEEIASTYSARPGQSEHQTGLAFDVGEISNYYGETDAGIWLKNNAHNFGFIIRYPLGKEYITGYTYEPWHIRYVGIEHATNIYNMGITLEEYLGV